MMNREMSRELTHDEKKAAEAAFRGIPLDPKWSASARRVYEGILNALQLKGMSKPIVIDQEQSQNLFSESVAEQLPLSEPESNSSLAEADPQGVPTRFLNREEAIEAGILIDVTPLAHQMGLELAVGMSRPLWEIGITASDEVPEEQYEDRVRNVLMALRLYLEKSEITSALFNFPTLLTFPPESVLQVFSVFAIAHKDPAAAYALTLLLPQEVASIRSQQDN